MGNETLQVLVGHFVELKDKINAVKTDMSAVTAGQEELKNDMESEISAVKNDIENSISAVTGNISALETKINAGQEELRQEISAFQERIKAGQAEFEERVTCTADTQLKNVTSMFEQQTHNLHEDLSRNIKATRQDLEATQRDIETQMAALDARTRRADGGNEGANADKVKPPKFDGSTSWAVFHRQFEAAAIHNDWAPREASHLLSVLQGQAADVLHSVPAEASYEVVVGALQDRFGDHQLAAAYRSYLKARLRTSGETVQEFAAAIEQLAQRALVRLPVGYIQTEAAHAFIDGVWDREVKQHLLMGGDRTANEALNQALQLKVAKAAAWPPARLREVTRVPTGRPPTQPERRRN
jgi:hypothetical protein